MNATPLVRTCHDVVQHIWIAVQSRVDESDWTLPGIHTLAVDQGDDRSEHWVGRRSARYAYPFSSQCNPILVSSDCHIRVASACVAEAVLYLVQMTFLLFFVGSDIGELIGRGAENVAETSS
jgi:hypothetical protein